MDSLDKKYYRLNITVTEELNWESKDLWIASYAGGRGRDETVSMAKNIFELLCAAYYDGMKDGREEICR